MYDHDDSGYNNLIDVFDHRALNDDLHRAGYQHVYVHHHGGPDDEHLDYHYPAPWPYDYRSGHHHDKQHDIHDDNRPQQHQHDDEHERARRGHHYDDGCPDNHDGLNDDHLAPRGDDHVHHGCSDDDAGYAHDDDHKPVVLDHIIAVIDKHDDEQQRSATNP